MGFSYHKVWPLSYYQFVGRLPIAFFQLLLSYQLKISCQSAISANKKTPNQIHIHLYTCTYVCMLCTYVCMYVCIDILACGFYYSRQKFPRIQRTFQTEPIIKLSACPALTYPFLDVRNMYIHTYVYTCANTYYKSHMHGVAFKFGHFCVGSMTHVFFKSSPHFVCA